MIEDSVKYQLVKAMVREMCEFPIFPPILESDLFAHLRDCQQGMSEWQDATEGEMREALAKARECLVPAKKDEKGKEEEKK